MRIARSLATIWHGAALRHLPIVVGEQDESPVRIELHGASPTPRDVSHSHVPVSLRPLILGVRSEGATDGAGAARCSLVVRDRASEKRLGEILLAAAGSVPLGDASLQLFRTIGSRNASAPHATRAWRHALSWIHAHRAPSRGDGLCMSAADLRCLNVYYMWPRIVYLVGTTSGDRSNLFPMDLVGRVDETHFLLALRATSPAIALMETSGVIAMSAAPADQLAAVYALGAHHRKATVDMSVLPFSTTPSAHHGLPVLSSGFMRELSVLRTHRFGSHVLFVCRVDSEHGSTPLRLAHISLMYAEWLARRGHVLTEAQRA